MQQVDRRMFLLGETFVKLSVNVLTKM